MGISDKKGFDATKDEAKRQLKNLVRDFSRLQKQDTKAEGFDNREDITTRNTNNSEISIPDTPSGMKKDLEKLKQDVPKRLPHEYAWSEKQEKAIKALKSGKIDEYKSLSADKVAKIKSDISEARTRISIARKSRDHTNIEKDKEEIKENKLKLKVYNLGQEQTKLEAQIGTLDTIAPKVEARKAVISSKLEEQLTGQQVMDGMSRLAGKVLAKGKLWGDPTWSQVSEAATELKEFLDTMQKARTTRQGKIDRLFSMRSSDMPKSDERTQKKDVELSQEEAKRKLSELVPQVEAKFERWQKLSSELNSPDMQTFKQLEDAIKKLKGDEIIADNELPGLYQQIDSNDKALSKIFEDVQKLKAETDLLNLQNKYKDVLLSLKETRDYLLDYDKYSNSGIAELKNLHYSELKKLNSKASNVIKRMQDCNDLASVIENGRRSQSELKEKAKQYKLEFESLVKDEIEEVENFSKEYDKNIGEIIGAMDRFKDTFTLERLEIFYGESAKEECFQRGEDSSNIIKDKSAERKKDGMTKEAIDISLETFYKREKNISKLNLKDAKEEIEWAVPTGELLLKEWEGDVDAYNDFYFVQVWPETPDGQETLQGTLQETLKSKAPYRAYVNPKKGFMVGTHAYRETDQKWREQVWKNMDPQYLTKRFGLEETLDKIGTVPNHFFNALQASDMTSYLYKLAVDQYRKDEKKTDLNAYHFPLREYIETEISNGKAKAAFYTYIGDRSSQGTVDSKEESTLSSTMLGSPVGQIKPFMLAQNPEKVGLKNGAVIRTKLAYDDSHLDTKYYFAEQEA